MYVLKKNILPLLQGVPKRKSEPDQNHFRWFQVRPTMPFCTLLKIYLGNFVNKKKWFCPLSAHFEIWF